MEIARSFRFQGRAIQLLLIASTLAVSWLGMMVVHEFGHVLFAWLSGGTVARVVLSPLEFSRTDLEKNQHPLFVAWGARLLVSRSRSSCLAFGASCTCVGGTSSSSSPAFV